MVTGKVLSLTLRVYDGAHQSRWPVPSLSWHVQFGRTENKIISDDKQRDWKLREEYVMDWT